jgi:tRNA threonylcarbamoyladenosine modification (KEOPS) complex  Pcc1 subunit
MLTTKLKIWIGEGAEKVQRAVELENEQYISSWVEGEYIVAEARASDAMSLLRTVDDFLSCVQVAERTLRLGPP